MGVYWNPANTSYYRSLETAARNVQLATQGTSGRQSVKTPTGINYVVDAAGTSSGKASTAKRATKKAELSQAEKAQQKKALEEGKLAAKGDAKAKLEQGQGLSLVSIRQV